jgi:predicted AlkP superfamily phosphohydrolase/phosphomutase
MRTVVVGVDAFDPKLFERLVDEGRLPTLERYVASGSYSRFAVAAPPQSEVSWTSIATGVDPGTHGIFDFVHRDPSTYALSPSLLSTRRNLFGTQFVPPHRAKTIFDEAVRRGYPATALWWPATFPARPQSPTRTLPGLGTPDIRGRLGVGSLFTPDDSLRDDGFKTAIERLDQRGGDRYAGSLRGPERKRGSETIASRADIEVEVLDNESVSLVVGDLRLHLTVGEWSPIIEVEFKIGRLFSVCGLTRAVVRQIRRELQLYFLPLQIHPLKTPWRYASPRRFAKEVWRSAGPFLTLGWPQDTTGLEEGWITDGQFLELCRSVDRTREQVFEHQMAEMNEGLLAVVSDSLDRIQHMYWRDRPDVIDTWYVSIDRWIGSIEAQLADPSMTSTKLVIVSDHGFTSLDYKAHLNRWLVEQGYLITRGEARRNSLEDADWPATQAYALGLNSLYVNVEGREGLGRVPAGDRERATHELAARLLEWQGPNGRSVVRRVYRNADIYHGRASAAGPDLVVGYAEGFRASAETGLGSWKSVSVEQNHDHWSGDHCVDPQVVPGVVFCNQGLSDFPAPSFKDFPPISLGVEIDHDEAPSPRISPEEREAIEERLKGLGYL